MYKNLQMTRHNQKNWKNLIITTFFSVALLAACGGGGGNNNPTVKQGTFIDSAVEGLSYVSGKQSGTTDANGTFSFEDGRTVRFSVGGIVIGEAKAQKVMTPIELVLGAEDETHSTVINIIRFLQTIDDDGNSTNGIRIPQNIRDLAEGKTVNFEGSEVEFENEGFFTEIETEHPLVSVASAQAHLRGTLLKSMAGIYSGTYSGTDSGTWTFTLNEAGVFTAGSGNSNDSGAFTLSTVGSTTTSNGSFTLGGSVSTGATFTGSITRSGAVSGAWKNDFFGDSGTFTGSKATANVASSTFSTLTSSLTASRAEHTATRLPDDKVLITGGFSSSTFPSPVINTAELYDPATDTFSVITSTMKSLRGSHTATLLPNGLVLLTGGQVNTNDGNGSNTAELYNPTTQTFTTLSSTMISPRGGHTATLLSDGKVLLAGGFNSGPGTLISDAELYDPTTQTFTALSATMASIRNEHTATLLPDGKVLLAGGNDTNVSIAELYDPTTQAFTAIAATMTSPRAAHTATLLPEGKVLLTGGGSNFDPVNPSNNGLLNTAEVYDPMTQTFTAITTTMTSLRFTHAATLLSNGKVFLTGGINVANNSMVLLNTAEVYGP